ncbi:MAG TPA: hypothetical protein VG326_14930 [Tepidisphaeraceae bacterium]|nr:hypothetical protein [Tepidisphaeraceae bacterium]
MNSKLIFSVADFNSRGELRTKSQYTYADLQRIPGADELITHFSANLWRSPEEFETHVPGAAGALMLRWRASAPTAGVLTLRFQRELSSLSLLVTGLNPDADRLTLDAFQRHQLRELHDSGVEPAFHLMEVADRPLIATINFLDPGDSAVHYTAALFDRCFAASYFRYQQLA